MCSELRLSDRQNGDNDRKSESQTGVSKTKQAPGRGRRCWDRPWWRACAGTRPFPAASPWTHERTGALGVTGLTAGTGTQDSQAALTFRCYSCLRPARAPARGSAQSLFQGKKASSWSLPWEEWCQSPSCRSALGRGQGRPVDVCPRGLQLTRSEADVAAGVEVHGGCPIGVCCCLQG